VGLEEEEKIEGEGVYMGANEGPTVAHVSCVLLSWRHKRQRIVGVGVPVSVGEKSMN